MSKRRGVSFAAIDGAPRLVEAALCPQSHATLLVIAIAPALLDPSFEERLGAQLDRLENQYRLHIPGKRKADAHAVRETPVIHLPYALLHRISAFTGR
ncbi:hypothetical protein P6U16_18215 [Rhizobium sp. 32-5/1]|uniref:hypothetical protein n=1 Tax=Rhizobium sp. 32-5/1 TaxID=3019602 RepID=UPI00240D9C0E|nr:hypothetical protein [Rhizobium sp. 32-5/1]WEZ82882.1 hypothetical protein P6U16_18215 [Rhizobium sp. 32-5/1]